MSAEKTASIRKIVIQNPKYTAQAYYFIFDALDFTITRLNKVRHVTGKPMFLY